MRDECKVLAFMCLTNSNWHVGKQKGLWVRELSSSQSYWAWGGLIPTMSQWDAERPFLSFNQSTFCLFRIGIEWGDRQGQRRLAINLFDNFLLIDGLSSPQGFTVSLQRFTFHVASQTQLSGNLSVDSLIVASGWAGSDWRRFGAFYQRILIPPTFAFLLSAQNVRQVDNHLTRYLLKVFSHSCQVSCFHLTNTPWPENPRNAISDARPSVREPLYSFPRDEKHCHWNSVLLLLSP